MEIKETQNDRSVDLKSQALNGVSIAICAGGGIAAIEVPKIARELRRMGAHVKIFATEAAFKFVGKDALEWASANAVTIQASGLAEHVSESDAVLVFPATADLIGKAAHGICSDACSTYIQSALGREQLVAILPTMHESLARSPATRANIRTLENFRGVQFIQPRKEEGKWKAPAPESIALEISFRFHQLKHTLQHKQPPTALVTLGGTFSKIDVARTLTNISTGTLGSLLIRKFLENGIQTTALCGNHNAVLPQCSGLQIIHAPDFADMHNSMQKYSSEENFSGFFHLAAISDFAAKQETTSKISSTEENLSLELQKLPKLIAIPSLASIKFKVACKFTASNNPLEREKAISLMNNYHLNAVVWNWGKNAFGLRNEQGAHILEPDSPDQIYPSKEALAEAMTSKFLKYLETSHQQDRF